MKQWQLALVAAGIALISAVGGYQLQDYLKGEDNNKTSPAVSGQVNSEKLLGAHVEEFSLADAYGAQRSLSEWQGKVIAINFWATWCPPCREEIPYFIALQEDYLNAGLQFVGIALQHADEVQPFLTEFNVNYPSLVGGDDVIKLAKKLGNGIGALPYTVIIDRQGKIAFTRRGPLSKAEAESVIQTLL